jgi:DUF4097 and DUF4098 domain-containing protein YvlB
MTATVNSGAELEHRIGANGRFALRLPAGSVAISGTAGDVARVRDRTGRSLADRFEIAAGSGSLELTAKHRFGITLAIGSYGFGAGPAPELEVEVPRGAAVEIDGASAEVEGRDLVGPKQFRTASGDLVLHAIAGGLEIGAVSGDVQIDADGQLDLRARTISGDFKLRAPSLRRCEIGTTSGDVHLDAAMSGPGPFGIKSISGDATIVSRSGLQVEAQTITGDLASSVAHRIESSPGRKLLIVGHPAATLTFKSVSGDLRIVEPRDQPAAPRSVGSETEAPDASEAARLEILHDLERGTITVDVAAERLAALEEA